jgi:AcrR family transcriptional regulator
MPTATRRRSPARRGHGEQLREEIVAAAFRLLEATGDATEVSLRAVAREVGVTPTSIYLHFEDVDALIGVVKQGLFADLGEAMESSIPDGADPVEVVRSSSHAYVRFAFEHAGLYRALFTSRHLAVPTAASQSFVGEQTFRQTQAHVAAAIGVDAESDEAAMLAMHLWASLHGMITLRTIKGKFPWPAIDVQVDDLVDRLFGSR